MSDNDIVLDTPAPQPYVPQEIDESKDYYSELVGEGRKYSDPAALAKAAVFKDEHIRRVEHEAAMLRAELEKRVNLEDVVDRLTSIQEARAKPDNRPPQAEPMVQPPAPGQNQDVSEIVRKEITAAQENTRRAENAKRVRAELQKRFGQNYESVVSERVNTLGLGSQFANNLAQTHPEAFLELFPSRHSDPSAANATAPTPSLNMAKQTQMNTGKKFKDYWAIYQKNPTEYFSVKVQNEIVAEAARQGPSFYE